MLFGSHLSIAGSMCNALKEAASLGLDCVQVFTKNQQQWRAKPMTEECVQEWRRGIAAMGWDQGAARTVSHASYLINLASPDDELWRKSIDLMQEEIERCERLGIALLVHHPGAFTTSGLDEGLARIADAYSELFRRTAGYRTVNCLENTAGGGSTIGRAFDELARLRALTIERTGQEGRIGFCFDTCHAHAAGYDMSTRSAADAVLDEFDAVCGASHLRVLHLNDSKGAAGSRLDRHEHIGKGTIGPAGFAAVLGRADLHADGGRPMIMETPKGTADDGTPWDAVNLAALKALIGSPPTRATEPSPAPARAKVASKPPPKRKAKAPADVPAAGAPRRRSKPGADGGRRRPG